MPGTCFSFDKVSRSRYKLAAKQHGGENGKEEEVDSAEEDFAGKGAGKERCKCFDSDEELPPHEPWPLRALDARNKSGLGSKTA